MMKNRQLPLNLLKRVASALLLAVFPVALSMAQITNKGARVTITNGTTVTAEGNFTNDSGYINNAGNLDIGGDLVISNDTIANAGTITVKGFNFLNNDTYLSDGALKGSLILDNASNVVANNNGTDNNVYNLETEGGGTKFLRGNWFITNELQLTNGNVRVTNGTADTLKLTATAGYTGGSSSSYIINTLYRESNGSNLDFPVGDVDIKTARLYNVAAGDVIGVATTGTISGTAGSTLNTLYTNRAWQLVRLQGNFDDLQMRVLFGTGDNIGAELDTLVLAQSNNKDGTYRSIGAITAGFASLGFATTTISPTKNFVALGSSQNTILKLQAFLQGSYNNSINGMTVYSRMQQALGNLFDGDTGSASVRMYEGYHVPINAIDTINIKLRETATGPFVATQKAFLLSDGSIRDFDTGTMDSLVLPRNQPGNYHVVVSHRNHLAVQHSNAAVLTRTEGTALDFTQIANIYGSGAVQVDMTPTTYALVAGNAINSDSETNASDLFNVQLVETNLLQGYHQEDVNLTGDVNAIDRNITSVANDFLYFSTVP